jgi:small subunit ribosomal protein S4
MARYTGPKDKLSRRFGVPLFGTTKSTENKNYPPGMHGPKGSRRKQSEYAVALAEKQKLRFQYGVLERLDNVVYRLGFASSRSASRQMVSHGHVQVNGRKVNISSYNLKTGDKITIRNHPKSRSLAAKNLELTQITPVPDWLIVDKEQFTGEVSRVPSRDEIAPIVNEQLIVELYSR